MFLYAVMGIQLLVTIIMGVYFYRQLKHTQEKPAGGGSYSRGEQERLNRMRSIRLAEPLSERARPKTLTEIVGQEEGIRALRAILCGSHPQHVIVYGPPGVGKTCAARLLLEEAKKTPGTPFRKDAPFIEVDATCVRFDERSIADPLLGSVHDPIYQGAGQMGINGIPQPREGAVTKAHGGVLFLDEIGEMHPIQMNKLLKVLEDRKVRLESAYYDPDDRKIPGYIHDIFKNGLPADFRLIGATTRSPDDLPCALRSRCMEVFFRPLEADELGVIARGAAERLGYGIAPEEEKLVGECSSGGRDAVNIVQMAAGIAEQTGSDRLRREDIEWVIESCGFAPQAKSGIEREDGVCGRVNGLAVYGAQQGAVLRIDAAALPGNGRLKVTGIVDQEEMGAGQGRTLRRDGMAKNAAENVMSVLKLLRVDMKARDVHVDFPGGVPVDGPSAGVAMCVAAYSALAGRPVDGGLAITGELGVRGDVLPVGGVSKKIEAAERAGLSCVLIPEGNWREAYARRGIRVFAVRSIREALSIALDGDTARFPLMSAKADSLAALGAPVLGDAASGLSSKSDAVV